MHKRIEFFCDFDGTISTHDMIGEIVKRFAPQKGKDIVNAVNRLDMSVKAGVEAVFGLLPSALFAEIAAYAQAHVRIRQGFGAFVDLCKANEWSITVVSGGFDFFVEHALKVYENDLTVVCNRLDTSAEFLGVRWNTLCDSLCDGGCGLCKPTVMRAIAPGEEVARVVVGDGVTDVKAAALADYVFARDKLLVACAQRSIVHTAFETFTDICQELSNEDAEVLKYV